MNFVEPHTGVHTQNIESYWSKQKYRIQKNERSEKGTSGLIPKKIHVARQYFKNEFYDLINNYC